MTEEATGTALVKQGTTEIVREGALLTEDRWPQARIAAAMKLLPAKYQDEGSLIALLALSEHTGLDIFKKEMWAWEHKGQLVFMTSRDGWLRLMEEDESITAVEHGLVYQNDTFEFEADGTKISILHKGSFDRGELVGAYCCVHKADGGDHIERRLIGDYAHLVADTRRVPWQTNPQDMLLARVVSAAGKVTAKRGGGRLYSEADFAMQEVEIAGQIVQAATEERAGALEAALTAEEAPGGQEGAGREIVVEEPSETPPEAESDAGIEAPGRFPCDECDKAFETQSALNGHKGWHSRQRHKAQAEAKAAEDEPQVEADGLPEGYHAFMNDDGYWELFGPDADLIDTVPKAPADRVLETALSHRDAQQQPAEVVDGMGELGGDISLQAVYEEMDRCFVPRKEIFELLNNSQFEAYRRDGAQNINPFDLDNEARKALMELIPTLGAEAP